jgi:hypothetical protein
LLAGIAQTQTDPSRIPPFHRWYALIGLLGNGSTESRHLTDAANIKFLTSRAFRGVEWHASMHVNVDESVLQFHREYRGLIRLPWHASFLLSK